MILFAAIDNQNHREFMENIYSDFHRLMYVIARKYTGDFSDQQDIVQDALEKLIKKVGILRSLPRCILSSYIVSTVRNTAINHLKQQGRRIAQCTSLDEEGVEEAEAPVPAMEDLMILAERRASLIALWSDMTEEDRILLEGKYLLDLSDMELSVQLHCKPSSIRIKLTRARRRAFERLLETEKV